MQSKTLTIRLRNVSAIFAVALFLTSAWAATNWKPKVLHNFGSGTDGQFPPSGLVSDAAGNLYGTTEQGGTHNYGTVFELSPTRYGGWTETVLHSFNNNGVDGWYPHSGLIIDATGNLYGTTIYGQGYGTVFEMSPGQGGGWTERVLYTFGSQGDGRYPLAALILDSAGNLFGTTGNGGIYCDDNQGCGTVFELSPNGSGGWTETLLHSFNDLDTGGFGPSGSVILDAAGNLYGTTSEGGINNPGGTVFELSPTQGGSWTYTVLYRFGPMPDGESPWAGLIFDAAGNLYGTTMTGGAYDLGALFELSPNGSGGWTETVLHSFGGLDGWQPLYGSLIFDHAGNLYGTTQEGGSAGGGTVFEFSPNGSGGWTETVLYNFCSQNGCTDGDFPFSGLTFDARGNLYGTTDLGGTYRDGEVFELTPLYPCIRCGQAIHR